MDGCRHTIRKVVVKGPAGKYRDWVMEGSFDCWQRTLVTPQGQLMLLFAEEHGNTYHVKGAYTDDHGRETFDAIVFTIKQRKDGNTDIQVETLTTQDWGDMLFQHVLTGLNQLGMLAEPIRHYVTPFHPETSTGPTPKPEVKGGKRGPTDKTQLRFKLYRAIKDKTPTLSYAAATLEACKQDNYDHHTEDTVRNAYRQMGVKWERSDRIR